MTGGLSLAELIQLLGAQGGGDLGAANTAGLLQSLGAGGLGTQSFGQPQGGQQLVAGQMSSPGAGGVIAGQNASIDPLSIIAKAFGILKTGVGLASPTEGNSSQGDSAGSGAATPQVSTASPTEQLFGSDFAASVGGVGPTETFNALKRAGLTDAQANDVMMLQTEAPEFRSGFGGPSLPLGASTTPGLSGTPSQLGASTTSGTNISGAVQGGLGTAAGLANLIQGIRSGNISQDFGGGLQGIGGFAQLLRSFPELASALGLAPELLGTIGAGAGGLGGLLGLAGGAQALASGNPQAIGSGITQLGSGALSTYQALQTLYPEVFGAASGAGLGAAGAALGGLGALYGAMGQGDPTGGAQAGGALTGAAATAPTALASTLGPALAGTVGGTLGAVAPVVAALISYFGNQDEMNAMRSWATLGKPVTQLHEAEVAALPAANQMFAQLQGSQDPNALMRAVQGGANALFTAYDRPQGPGGPLSPEDYFKRTGEDPSGLHAQQQQLLNNEFNAIQQLHNMGITNQQLGGLQVNPLWGSPYLGGMAAGEQIPNPLYGQGFGGQPMTDVSAGENPAVVNQALGGPLMSMLAYLNPSLYAQIGGQANFGLPAVQSEIQQQLANQMLVASNLMNPNIGGGGGDGGE